MAYCPPLFFYIVKRKSRWATIVRSIYPPRMEIKMENRMTFSQYRRMDILIFTVLTAVFECIATLATAKWFWSQPVAISITLSLILIVMHRWGAYAAIVAAVGGITFCIASGAEIEHYLIYAIGNTFAITSLIYFKIFGKESVRKSFLKTLLFATTSYLSVVLGRWLVSLIFGAGFAELVAFLTTDLITLLFAVVILYGGRGVDGLIEDQKQYVIRVNKKEETENVYEDE